MSNGILKQVGVWFIVAGFVIEGFGDAIGRTERAVPDLSPDIEAVGQSAPAPAPTATPAPTPTPTPSPTPTPPPCKSPTGFKAGGPTPLPVDLAICLNYRAAPGLGIPLDAAGKPTGGFVVPRSLAPIQIKTVPTTDGLVFQFRVSPPGTASCGPTPGPSASPAVRLLNGVPFNDCEQRLAIVIQRMPSTPGKPGATLTPPLDAQGKPDAAAQRHLDQMRLVLEVNRAGACVETSTMMTDDQFAACKVSPSPTPKPTPTPPTGAAPSTTAAPAASSQFDGEVTAPWAALNELFARPVPKGVAHDDFTWGSDEDRNSQTPVRGPVGYRICYVEGPEFNSPARADGYRQLVQAQSPSALTPETGCFDLVVVYREGTKGSYNYNYGQKSGSASSDPSSGSTVGTSARLHALATAGVSSAPDPSPSPASKPRLTVTLAQPLTAFWQLSGEGNVDNAVLPSLTKQTNSTLTSVVQQQAEQRFGNLVPGLGTSTTSTAFTTVDADILQRLLPSTFRGYTESGTLTKQPQAFDGTDVLGLQPFNASEPSVVTAGAKISSVNPLFSALGQRLGVSSIGWFHDSTIGESGTVFHLDQDVSSNLSLGFSHVIGNRVTPPANAYVSYPNPDPSAIAYPVTSPAPNPVLHSTNTVVGALLKFGNGGNVAQPFQLYTRMGTNGYGRDYLAAISGSDLGNGHVIRADGTTLGVSVVAGYRHISYEYNPLLSNYNPLAGNGIYFGRANLTLIRPKNTDKIDTIDDRSGTVPITLTIAGVYAGDIGRREYGSFGISPSIPVNAKPRPENWTYSLNGTFQRSYISTTVLTRQSGNFVYPQGPLNLLSNDATSLDLQLKNPSTATDWTATVTAGLSLLHSPSCSGNAIAPKCESPYANKPTWSINAGLQSLVLYANSAPGSQRVNAASVSSTIPANNILTTALIAFHFCAPRSKNDGGRGPWGAEPSLTYKNNIAQDGSAFQPGTLLEAGVDIGPTNGIDLGVLGKAVLSVTYQNAVNTHGSAVSLANHGFGISLISVSQAMWQAHKVKTDKCASTSGDDNGGGAATS